MNDIKIFVSHRIDLDSETIDNPLFYNVRCGAVFDKRERIIMAGDDTGDNISDKRDSFCELTIQYWAWKNMETDYYGLCHYRRYFSFSEKTLPEDIHGAINYDYLDEKTIKEMDIDIHAIEKRVSSHDFIVSAPANLRKVKTKTVYNQYKAAPHLNIKDLDLAIDILNEKYPEFKGSANNYLNGFLFYPCNMFIMKKVIFNNYCEWLFSILFELERRMDISDYSLESLRSIGHIAERLLGVYFTYIRDTYPQYKTAVLQRSIIWNTERLELPKPAFTQNNIPIVMSCSDFFVPYAGVTLQSILMHSQKEYNYDIVFLHTSIEKENQKQLQLLINEYSNVSLRFINITSQIYNFKLISNNHVSVETFYRLLAHQIFLDYDKIIYLDSDIIVLIDIAELYHIEIGDNLLAATIDADHAGEYNGAIPGVKDYCDKVLKLSNPFSYFQAGVLVFNIREFNKAFEEDELVQFASKREYMYVDQDVLNMKCEGRVHFLDMTWNVMTDCNRFRINGIIKMAPLNIYQTYMEARKTPKIIHYAGVEKPWNNPLSDMADIYWTYARKTHFYETIVLRMTIDNLNDHKFAFAENLRLRRIIDQLFPKGSRRREIIKRIYYRMLG